MKIPWPGNRCIFCPKESTLCEEHIIPKAIGGILTCRFLCECCNSRFGHDLEASVRSDYSILPAAKNLRSQIPELAKKIIESHPHIGYSEIGPVPGYIRNNEFRVKPQTIKDGSLIQPTDDAKKSIANSLRTSGRTEIQIQNTLAAIDEAPENERIEIEPGRQIVKRSIQKVESDLSKGKFMSLLIPAKIAFEFLAIRLGTAIYDDAPQWAELRQDFSGEPYPENYSHGAYLKTNAIKVERRASRKYAPFHGICFEGNDSYVKVRIRLFGWLSFHVHFLHLAVDGPCFAYTHKLDTGEEIWNRYHQEQNAMGNQRFSSQKHRQ